jgi:branched-chain amino acid transport system substrate-binding protein
VRPAIRIGVLVDCTGVAAFLHDSTLAGAEWPLIERGAHLLGAGPASGVSGVDVAGRRVELVEGCTENGLYTRLIRETRRLVEVEHVDAVIGGMGYSDAIVFRELARRYPTVPFLVASSWAQEATMQSPAPNLYRFFPDFEQGQAGLATYAYRRLGWRRVATVAEDYADGWGAAGAFTAEFCALGGRVTRVWTPLGSWGKELAERVPPGVDGVAVFENWGSVGPAAFVRAYLAKHRDARRKLILGSWMLDPYNAGSDFGPLWHNLRGVVTTTSGIADPRSAETASYAKEFAKTFPGLGSSTATDVDVLPYRDSVTALLRAIVAVHGDLGPERAGLRRALVTVRLGPVRLGRDRQAVSPVTLVEIDGSRGSSPTFHTIRTIQNVDQTLGGLLDASDSPSRTSPACRRATLPRWDH